jgi:hypothetical protein
MGYPGRRIGIGRPRGPEALRRAARRYRASDPADAATGELAAIVAAF